MRTQSAARAEFESVCPSCGRPATATKTGHCIHCLRPLPGFASAIDTDKILRLSDFERTRAQVRRSGSKRVGRTLISILSGVLLAAAVVILFEVCLRWIMKLFSLGIPDA